MPNAPAHHAWDAQDGVEKMLRALDLFTPKTRQAVHAALRFTECEFINTPLGGKDGMAPEHRVVAITAAMNAIAVYVDIETPDKPDKTRRSWLKRRLSD